MAVALALAVPLTAASAVFESGSYLTVAGATVEERGDRVPDGARSVPLTATLTLELDGSRPPSLTAVIENAVLEGGVPFRLTVRSSAGSPLADGTFRWNGVTGWSGGHLWQVTISDVALQPGVVPEPGTALLFALGLGLLAVRSRRSR